MNWNKLHTANQKKIISESILDKYNAKYTFNQGTAVVMELKQAHYLSSVQLIGLHMRHKKRVHMKHDGGGRIKIRTIEQGFNLMSSMCLGCVSHVLNKTKDPHTKVHLDYCGTG